MLLYSAIARGGTILVSHEVEQHNFESVALSMLPNIPRMQDTKCTYTSDKYLFHVLVENGISYLCTAESSFGRLTPFAFLNQIKKRFQNIGLGMRAATAGSHELDREFSHVLAKEMENSTKGEGESVDQLQKMRAQVNEVTGIMSKNIEKVLDRGDKLEVLVDKAADLEASAVMFKSTSRKVHRKMKCRNLKMWLIIISVVLIALTLIILMSTNVIPVHSTKKVTSKPK